MLDNSGNENLDRSAAASFTRYLRPLPGKPVVTEKPILTNIGAIKANMLPDQGKRPLASIQTENVTQLKNATPLRK